MWTRRIKIAACVLCFCVLMVGVGKGLRYVLKDDTKSHPRLLFHDMYEQDNIDVLFVGSSHSEYGIDPAIMDEALHQNTFNLSTAGQRIYGSYLLIKEAAKQNELRHIYLDVYFRIGFDARKGRDELTDVYNISDYLKPSVEKYAYLLSASDPDHYANSFVVARRDAMQLFDLDYLTEQWIVKSESSYQDHTTVEWGDYRYTGKGHFTRKTAVENWNFFDGFKDFPGGRGPIRIEDLTSDWTETLDEIIAFCNKKGIGLTFYSIPVSDYLLQSKGNYDEYIDYMKAFAQDRNVEYYDFNLCKRAYFTGQSELFWDKHHLNADGAEVFSRLLGRFLSGELSPDELFYDSYADKLAHMPLTVFGVNYEERQREDGTKVRDCRVVACAPDKLECEIYVKAGGGLTLLQPYSRNTTFQLDAEQKGACVIRYRSIDDPATEHETLLFIP